MIKKIKFAIPLFFTLCVIVFFHYTHLFCVKYYPALVDFLIFMMFFTSLFQNETIIQKGVRLVEPVLKPRISDYIRKITYIWTIFLFFNFCIALITVFMSENLWALYNGFISYLLVGFVFVIEYIVRVNFKRKYDC